MSDSMSEVITDCPACGEAIPFYETVDERGECPECGTHRDELFAIAIGEDEQLQEVAADA